MADEYAMTWGAEASSNDRLWGAVTWLASYVAPFIGPLVILLLFQEKSKFIRYHSVQALAFHAFTIAASICVAIISAVTCGFGGVLGLPLMFVVFVPLYGAYLGWNGHWDGIPGISSFGR